MINKEAAEKEISSWLEYKKIGSKKREAHKENIDNLIEAVCDGVLVLNDDKSLKHKLKFPLEGEISTSEITFKPRVTVDAISKHIKNVPAGDAHGMLCGYAAALSGTPSAVIKALDSEDYSLIQSIVIFFL